MNYCHRAANRVIYRRKVRDHCAGTVELAIRNEDIVTEYNRNENAG